MEPIPSLKKEKCILLTTQNIVEAERLADKICILKNGSIQQCDTPSAIKQQHSLHGYKLDLTEEETCDF